MVLLKIAALNTLLQMKVNKLPDLSKKVKTLNWSHLITIRMTKPMTDPCVYTTVTAFMFTSKNTNFEFYKYLENNAYFDSNF